MAHKIEAKDRVFTLTKAWHGLETVVEKIEGFGFEVEARPLYLDADTGPIPSHKAICDNEGNLLSVMKASYELIPNGKVWEAVQTAVAQIEGARVVSAGSIKGRKQTFVSVELDGLSKFEAGGDSHTVKLNLVNSHDGSKALTARIGVTRMICANTCALAESEAVTSIRLYHTKSARAEISGFSEAVKAVIQGTELYKAQMAQLVETPANAEEAFNFAAALVGSGELSTRSMNQAEQIASLFKRGIGNDGTSRYSIFNGITEFYTHHAASDSRKLFESSEFGAYGQKKEDALAALLNPDKWEAFQRKGKALLAA